MTNEFVISIDPSGNFYEGKGTTGIVFGDMQHHVLDFCNVCAVDYDTQMDYFEGVLDRISDYCSQAFMFSALIPKVHVVIEDYRLYNHRGNKADSQANSLLETPRIIGVIEYHCYVRDIPVYKHMASDVKNRWSDTVLEDCEKLVTIGKRKHIPVVRNIEKGETLLVASLVHERDALRHYHHFVKYTSKKEK